MTADAITLEWAGEEYVISASETFEVGEQIEEIVTLPDIGALGKKLQFRKIAKCYGIMLRHAGARATDQQVFTAMMDQFKAGSDKKLVALQAVEVLTHILMDGAPVDADSEEKPDDKKKTGGS